MFPLVSVILPFYNAENTIAKTIESILFQTFADFELLCIDNNSCDGSRSIVKQFVRKDRRVAVIDESRQGVAFAHNKGCSAARGKYIARIDADDVAYSHKLGIQVAFLDENPRIGAVATQATYVSSCLMREGFSRFVAWSNSVCSYHELQLSQFIESPIIHPTSMWRREVGERFGNCEHGNFPEDYEMWLRWLQAGVEVVKIKEQLLYWVDSATRLTRTHDAYSVDAFYRIKTMYLAQWLKVNNPHYPKCLIWAGGRKNSKRARLLASYGIQIIGFIDIKHSQNTIHYLDIPSKNECFILSYVANWGAREKVRDFLVCRGFVEGRHFICVS